MAEFGERVAAFRSRHKRLEALGFFAGGFCFDLTLLERIDSRPMLIHQGSYLCLLALLLAVDHHYSVLPLPKDWRAKVLRWRTEVIHFLFGTLLNAFLVFYFKAASGWVPLVFLFLLGGLLVANEMARFRELGPLMRVALWSFACVSYLGYLLPVLFGYLSAWLFLLATVLAALATFGAWFVSSRWTPDPGWRFSRACLPGLGIEGLLLALYLLHVVPPVPLSIKRIGVYHGATRDGGRVELLSLPSAWPAFLRPHGETDFLARPGDRVCVFLRVFAPRNFRDGVRVRWALRQPGRWKSTDAIPLTLSGGEAEGWSAIAWKDHWEPGDWRVSVETNDGRAIGHLRFRIDPDESKDERVYDEEEVVINGAARAPLEPRPRPKVSPPASAVTSEAPATDTPTVGPAATETEEEPVATPAGSEAGDERNR